VGAYKLLDSVKIATPQQKQQLRTY